MWLCCAVVDGGSRASMRDVHDPFPDLHQYRATGIGIEWGQSRVVSWWASARTHA
ncbi:hypothetical protein [Dokdonella immobilis]|uniref:hypothetical protein n=1 Tax=Dokdonella immobilis TaxID=578942 RepID=UPI0015871781|nr:hypothetical protein [Dokdonella immobilis]